MKIKNELERQREIEEMRMDKWRTDSIYFPHDLNTHDPHEMYRWEEPVSGWVWGGRVLGTLGFFVGIYMLTLLTFLF